MKDNVKQTKKLSEKKLNDSGLMPFIISEKPLVPVKAGKYDKLFAKLITYGKKGNNIHV